MNGFQVTFFTHQGRRHGNAPDYEWLMHLVASLGIQGATLTMGTESLGRSGKLHSKYFVELADQPIEVAVAMTEDQFKTLFEHLEAKKANLFYIKSPVEFGRIGSADRSA